MKSLARQYAFRFVLMSLLLVASRGAVGQTSKSATDSTPPVPQPSSDANQETMADTGLAAYGNGPGHQPLSDLTLGNFFSDGWDDDFAMRTRATGTPDLPLLRDPDE